MGSDRSGRPRTGEVAASVNVPIGSSCDNVDFVVGREARNDLDVTMTGGTPRLALDDFQ